jgi:NAD(P)-dependent dehydrogenase (short-subunit alcohol dehydrogenase family)
MKTVLITGCSSGFGLETAKYFIERDWNVIATMRTPREDVLPAAKNLRILPLDVTDPDSIRSAIAEAGPIDVLVNNAGIGMLNAVEGTPMEMIREIFETNTFGVMAMTQSVVPQFRERGSGVVVNVTSAVTLKSLPLMSVYTASKAAVNAFSESLALELQQFDVRVRVVIPGRAPETPFAENGRKAERFVIPKAYEDMAQKFMEGMSGAGQQTTRAEDVAEAIWIAATDPSSPMRLPAGADAVEWARSAKAVSATS